MIFLDVESSPSSFQSPKAFWDRTVVAQVSGSEPWLRSTRRAISGIRDEQGHPFPLRDEQVWVNVSPTQTSIPWRAEADILGTGVVGRGSTLNDAILDWKKRFRTTLHVFIAMRPFEMTPEDRVIWDQLQVVIDIPRYKATKPIVIRQTGVVRKASNGHSAKVQWSDGSDETVAVGNFDEAFSRYRVGQPFEATVYRHPTTFRLIRAEATRKLLAASADSEAFSKALWNRVVEAIPPESAPVEFDADFWLAPPQGQS